MGAPKCPKCGKTMRKNGIYKRHSGSRVQRWACYTGSNSGREMCYQILGTHRNRPYATKKGAGPRNPQFKRSLRGVRRVIVTAAQNATPVHKGFFTALTAYCKAVEAELIVIPLRYKNPTSRWTASQANDETWAPELAPYLYNQRRKLNANLVLLADIKTQPTATRPLSGFETITHGESGILGHTKLQLLTVPTLQGKYPKIMTTTGAVTVPNYTDSKAGKKGEFHHTQAACMVEIDGGRFHLRQINAARDGSFIDLGVEVGADGKVSKAPPALGVVFGDLHRAFLDKRVERATFGVDGIVEALDAQHMVFHDLHDGYAENPHHAGNPFVALAKRKSNKGGVEAEILADINWLKRAVGKRSGIVVPSNHDNFLARWVRSSDWRTLDPENMAFYLRTALHLVLETKMTKSGSSTPDPFTFWVDRLRGGRVALRCLRRDESFRLGEVEVGLHGDIGPHGAVGSRMNLRRIGVKTIIGHSHSPGIEEGCYQCGTSTPLQLEYNLGPSGWLNTHCVVYANGKRSLINVIDGKWRG